MTRPDQKARRAGPHAGLHNQRPSPYAGPAGGWGSARSVAGIISRTGAYEAAARVLPRQNKPAGFACVSCAWAKPAEPHALEFCENGAKATAWEGMSKRAGPDFFYRHTVAELRNWSDHDLESAGRLTEPLAWDAGQDRYVPISWETALSEIGAKLERMAPDKVVFYTSGRASLEASYMYQLMARVYGTNNLPDSSNMCHESTSVGLQESLGLGVGTVRLEDFQQAEAIFFFGQNVGSNSPRMLHELQKASERGVPIVTFNPLREKGLEQFKNPQRPAQMLGAPSTPISSHYHQVVPGGDIAALAGMCKSLLDVDERARAQGQVPLLDWDFIREHTAGFEDFAGFLRATSWDDIQQLSGLDREALEDAARIYARADAVLLVYGMGLTQHLGGVDNVQMLVNFALMRGNVGKAGAGICPVRGHSNVQGQRTVGITEKPELAPLDRLAKLYAFEPPRKKGLDTIGTCESALKGDLQGFVALGGNFVRAAPDTASLEPAWSRLDLTVHISTTLNRSHLFPGKSAYVLPCLGRSEIDRQAGGVQFVSIEDSTSCVHGSIGRKTPAGTQLRSEPAIIAGIALAIPRLGQAKVPWQAWMDNYALIREAIEATYPQRFSRYNERIWNPGGFPLTNAPRERIWNTDTRKANFKIPQDLTARLRQESDEETVLQLMTLRSNDQFNTTIYGYEDRFRGISGTRQVVLMNADDIRAHGLTEGERVMLHTAVDLANPRSIGDLRVVAYDIPRGSCAAYYPECNVLLPVWHHARESHVPAAKSIPVRIAPASAGPRLTPDPAG